MPNFARRSIAAIADRDSCKDVWVAIPGVVPPLTSPASSLWKDFFDDIVKAVMLCQVVR